jgi:transcriptional regulator
MFVPPAFRMDRAASLAFAASRGFGLVVAHDGMRPVAAALPFRLDYRDDGSPRAQLHVARANPLAALAERGGEWLIAVSGADAYVAPGWYVSPDQVPTWLYETVHLSGAVRVLPARREHLDRITQQFEQPVQGQPAWEPGRVTSGRLAAMMNAIVAVEMEIGLVEGSAKLNQHKSDADHVGVVLGLQKVNDPRGERSDAVLRTAIGERSDAVLRTAMARQIAERMVALRPHLSYEPATKEACDV